MPLIDIEVAARMMENSGREIRFRGAISSATVAECEAWLSTPLPLSYRAFLMRWGSLAFGGSDFYGFTKRGFDADRAPSFLWLTKTVRARNDIGAQDVVVKSSGFGPYFVLRCGAMGVDGECPVQLADGTPDGESFMDFGAFLLNEIKSQLEM